MRIVVGLSGGVDSSVTAALLKEQGEDVVGMFMLNWDERDEDGICSAESDARDVRKIAEHLDIPNYTVNFVKEYWDRVFTYFLNEYKAGRTPNPDVLCNKEIKFNAFLDKAMDVGAEKIATGHYAKVEFRDGFYRLLKAKDETKDQTYFLCMLNQQQLSKAMFPLGDYLKSEVRQMAKDYSIHVADKKDSTGVCFIGERNFKEFLKKYLPAQGGDMIDITSRKVVGHHDGLMYYTMGQRRGLGIGGAGDGRSWFVVDKDLEKNQLLVVQGEDSEYLLSTELFGETPHWIAEIPEKEFNCTAKFRYRQKEQGCKVIWDESGCRVVFNEPQRAITPGQFTVFYKNDECIGSSIITKSKKKKEFAK